VPRFLSTLESGDGDYGNFSFGKKALIKRQITTYQ
jgi:hypothetical protein